MATMLRNDIMAMGIACMQVGLTTPEGVSRYLVLGHRFEQRADTIDRAANDLRYIQMGLF